MSTYASAPLPDDLRARLDALDVDVSCALRFSRATLYALAAMSSEARSAIDRCLSEESAIVRIDDLQASAAIAATLNEARQHIAAGEGAAAAVRDLERMLVESAADSDDGLGAMSFNERAVRQSAG
ncbi:MAG: hypothetical protein V4466_01205 [Pseudomonadota bacterium]